MPALKLTPPVEKTFQLEKTDAMFGDGSSQTMITIRQARQRDVEKIGDIQAEYERIYGVDSDGDDEVTIRQRFNLDKLNRYRAFCTIVSCELMWGDGALVFSPAILKDERKFEEAWGALDPMICQEIIEKIFEVNLSWKPSGE